MVSSAMFVCLILLCTARMIRTQDSGGSLCTQLYRMSQVCLRENGNQAASTTQCCRGKVGPRGLRGPPGSDAEVDYARIDGMISEKYEERISKLEELQTWYKASDGRFYKLFRKLVNYATAATECRSHGAILASAGVRNQSTRWELLNLVKSGGKNTWIGQNDISHEGRWVWEDGVVATLEDADWLSGQPSNYGGGEDCGHYWMQRGYKINDAPCVSEMFFVCEKSL